MTTAFVFPGQGAQTIGMGRDLADAYPAARAVFEEVDDVTGRKAVRFDLERRARCADTDPKRPTCVDGNLFGRNARP